MLAAKGVTAWQRTLASLVPAAPAAPAGRPGPLPAGLAAELISVLAAAVLAGTAPDP